MDSTFIQVIKTHVGIEATMQLNTKSQLETAHINAESFKWTLRLAHTQ